MAASLAAVFMIDGKYLEAFEVFWFTLRETKSLSGVPIVIVTTDERLSDDAFIRAVCADVVVIPEAARLQYKKVKGGATPDWRVPDGGTAFYFNKFHIFLEKRFGQIFYFDVDMLCLNNIDGLVNASKTADITACRTYGGKAFKTADGDPKPKQEIARIVNEALFHGSPGVRPREAGGLNSGVLCLSTPALSEGMWSRLVKMAQEEEFVGDQNVIASLIYRDESISFSYLPLTYNMPRRMADQLTVEQFVSIRDKIHILHFNAGHPWKNGQTRNYVDFIWWDTKRRSRELVLDTRASRDI